MKPWIQCVPTQWILVPLRHGMWLIFMINMTDGDVVLVVLM